MGRAPCCDKANVKRGPWCPEEDAKLKAYIEEHGTGGNWIALPHKIGLKRCGKSCRLRWLNYLQPNIKHGDFSEEEDFIICNLYISIGSRWSIIAAQLPGRTDNGIKNYWNTKLKKRFLGKNKKHHAILQEQTSQRATGIISDDSINSECIPTSVIERMQLHMKLQSLYNPLSSCHNPAFWPKMQTNDHISTWKDACAIEANYQTECSQVNLHHMHDMNCSKLQFDSPPDMNPSAARHINNEIFEDKNGFFEQDEHEMNGLCDYRSQINWEKESWDSWATSSGEFQEEASSSWDLSAVFQTDSILQNDNRDL
ncbi:transcription factor MYB36-like [Zingiber officinale]|uniref:Uncharacterized protein n=1 Tax=Zingiber officinale TaxID=94328 RepID=A0A8J5H244_ZINOF|nr:transcription factor MYB36-like [Zingiber officinale]KAG6511744.1 hypothetical protein ZIOFF_029821 [Zingiber officinale]